VPEAPAPTVAQAGAVAGTASADGATGRVVGGRYTLRATVGTGGMGTVWRAFDEVLRRDVAVKEVLLPRGLPPQERALLCERTLREARAAAALNHPSVVRVYDVVTDSERPWIVMELVQARSLAEIIRQDGPLPVQRVAEVGLAVLGALEAAHAAQVLHRDVKPGNVLLGTDGRTTLTDFGVARTPGESPLTSTGLLLGSPQYIAPERARGRAFGPPSDLWSLGATLYAAVEGRAPFDRGDPLPTMTAVVSEPPDPATLAGPLLPVLSGLLEKDPAMRWDADRARAGLQLVLAVPTGEPAAPRTPQHSRRSRAAARPASGAPAHAARRASGAPAHAARPGSGAPAHAAPEPAPAAPTSGAPALPAPAPGPPAHPAPAVAGVPATPAPISGPPGHGRAAVPAPPAPPRPRGATTAVPYLDDLPAGRPRRRRPHSTTGRLALLAAAAVLVVLVAGFGTYGLSTALHEQGTAAPRKTTPAASPLPSATPVATTTYTDPGGRFSLAVPKGWEQTDDSPLDFEDKDAERLFRVNVLPAADQRAAFAAGESYARRGGGGITRYERLRLEDTPTRLAGRPAAEWEWTFTARKTSTRKHVLVRGITVDGTSYMLYLSVPEARFAADRAFLDEATRTFRLTR